MVGGPTSLTLLPLKLGASLKGRDGGYKKAVAELEGRFRYASLKQQARADEKWFGLSYADAQTDHSQKSSGGHRRCVANIPLRNQRRRVFARSRLQDGNKKT